MVIDGALPTFWRGFMDEPVHTHGNRGLKASGENGLGWRPRLTTRATHSCQDMAQEPAKLSQPAKSGTQVCSLFSNYAKNRIS